MNPYPRLAELISGCQKLIDETMADRELSRDEAVAIIVAATHVEMQARFERACIAAGVEAEQDGLNKVILDYAREAGY